MPLTADLADGTLERVELGRLPKAIKTVDVIERGPALGGGYLVAADEERRLGTVLGGLHLDEQLRPCLVERQDVVALVVAPDLGGVLDASCQGLLADMDEPGALVVEREQLTGGAK